MPNYSHTRLVTTELVKLASVGLFNAVEIGLQEARKYASSRLKVTGRLIALRSIAIALALLATVWFCVGATLALAEIIPLWASWMALSGALALGSYATFVAKPDRADPKGKSLANEHETENENGR